MILFFLSCSREIPAAPSCEEGQEIACFRGSFRTLLGSPVENMKICAPEEENIECVWSDEEGTWKMSGLPKNTNVFLTAEHPDFVSTIFPQHTSMSWYDWYKVAIPTAVMNSNANRLDVELQENRGHMLFLVWEGLNIGGVDTENVEGITAQVSVNDDLLFYGDALGLASANLTETSSSGSGGLLNIQEGEIELSLRTSDNMIECGQDPMFHYIGTIDTNIPIPIRAGFTTAIDVLCPP